MCTGAAQGGVYYYKTQTNKSAEQTLMDVQAYAAELGIPYSYVLLDSVSAGHPTVSPDILLIWLGLVSHPPSRLPPHQL
jgi:hypothetical protein